VRNKIVFLSSVLGLAALVAPSARASVLYDNDFGGLISGDHASENAWGIDANESYSVVDSFSLSSDTSLGGVNIYVATHAGDVVTALDWSILDNSSPSNPFAGSVLYSGSVTLPSSTFIKTVAYGDIYELSFTIATGTLTAGTTYWLELNGVTSSLGTPVDWDQSDGPSTAYRMNGSGQVVQLPIDPLVCNGLCTGSESFQLLSTPEPGTMALLFGGLIGIAALRRRARS
jgi:hypothetical protein